MNTIVTTEMDQVYYIKLHRPEVRNAFNQEMIAELTQTFKLLQNRTDLRAAVIHGEGKAFCAGGDLNWMKSMVNYTYEENLQDAQNLFNMFEAQKNIDIPVLAFAHGAVYGGALGLLANCDYVMAEQNTAFCFSEVKIGIAPAVISSFVLEKTTPAIKHYMMSATVFNEYKAKELGLIHEICQPGEGHHKIQTPLHQYKECGPIAVRKTKNLFRELKKINGKSDLNPAVFTTKLIAELRVSEEGQEGLKSFLEKRNPSWKE